MKCWAAALGDCSAGQSREHYLSKAIFGGPDVTIHGLPWCREPKAVPVSRLVSKALCTKHNSDLSPVDAAGAYAYTRISHLTQVRSTRQVEARRQSQKLTYSVSGLMFERWLLKLLTTLVFDHAPNVAERGIAPVGWANLVFGRCEFGSGCGLYFARLPRYRHVVEHGSLAVNVLAAEPIGVAGGEFALNGAVWLVTTVPIARDGFLHRPRSVTDWEVIAGDGPRILQSLDFNWAPRPA